MRAHQFLLEYRRDITLTKQGDALVQHARGFDGRELTGEEILEQIEAGDPTKNKMYVLWLIRQYLNRQFRLEDMTRIRGVLRTYHEVKNRLPLEQRDIGRMTYYALEDLVDSFTDADATPVSSSQYSQIPDLKILYDGPYGFLAIPKTMEASCAVGSGTRWCTAAREDNEFEYYNKKGDLYVWIEKGDKFQFHFEDGQFMDSRNRPISPEKMHYFRNTNPITKKLFMEREREILASGDTEEAYYYARNVIQGRWAEAEPFIMKDPEWTYAYARSVIRGRWAEAEPHIMKDSEWAYSYAREVIQGRWAEAEPIIMKDPHSAYMYAKYVIRGRWAEAEPYIMKDPSWAYWYATYVIHGRWGEAEPFIMKDPEWAYYYAKDVIQGRWVEAEPHIMKYPQWAKEYSEKIFDITQKKVMEVADNSYYYVNYHKSANIRKYHFTTKNDNTYHVTVLESSESLTNGGRGTVLEIHFYMIDPISKNKIFDITGTGDGYRIFGTVGNILKKETQKHNPEMVRIISRTSEKNRSRLYEKLARRFASEMSEYSYFGSEPGRDGEFVNFLVYRRDIL
jgi:hypothetical protein